MVKEFKKHEKEKALFDFKSFIDKDVVIHFSNGREIHGVLKGYDAIANMVLDKTVEIMKDKTKRELGLIIIRGPNVSFFSPNHFRFQLSFRRLQWKKSI